MDVGDLIEILSTYPSNMAVAVAGDEEWNDVRLVSGFDPALTPTLRKNYLEIVSEADVLDGEYYNYSENRDMTPDDYEKVLVIW